MLQKFIILFLSLIFTIPITANTNSSNTQRHTDEDIVKLAKQITKWKRIRDHNIWVECGIKYTESQIFSAALEWAKAITEAQRNTKYTIRKRTVNVRMSEALGIIVNESRFDRCAIGPNPRKFAYKHKILEKKKSNYSHTLEELKHVFTHPKFKYRKADVGPGQIVVYKKPWEEVKEYLTLYPGIQKVFDLLARKGKNYRTIRPSSRWPGTQDHRWYTDRVIAFGSSILHTSI